MYIFFFSHIKVDMEEEKKKKLTATNVMKSFGLNPEELNDLLNQIFNALEEEEGAETDK